jgi:surface antigen
MVQGPEHLTIRGARFPRLAAGAVLAGMTLVLAGGAAVAQVNPFHGYTGPTLNKRDLEVGQAAMTKLLAEDHAAIAASETWENPESGNHGKLTVLRSYTQKGLPCRAVQSHVEFRTNAVPRTMTLRVCRLASGEWKPA